MLCPSCAKLAFQYTNKKCLRCQGQIAKNIASICDQCSDTEKQCAACLRKMQNSVAKKHSYGGCGSCRK